MTRKPRLDELLVARGLFPNVHDARAAVLAGEVVVGEHRETSAGRRLDADVPLRLKARKEKDALGFASRGGAKLEAALGAFPVDPAGLSCADLGASTGGFTDCLLQHGAAHVAAIDVGTNQLAWGLRRDPRVSSFEQTNVSGIDVAAVGGPFGLVTADLSFIRLETVLGDVVRLLGPGASFLTLVKPQFEVARGEVGAGGIVRGASLHEKALAGVVEAAGEAGLACRGLAFSPVRGAKGNIEFLLWAQRAPRAGGESATMGADEIRRVVAAAHEKLGDA